MEHDDFLELFYSNLRSEMGNDKFVESLEKLIDGNNFTKKKYMKLLEEVYHE